MAQKKRPIPVADKPSARPLTVGELAQQVAGDVVGDEGALIHGVSSIEEAEKGDIVFAENDRFLSRAEKSRASAIVAFLDATTPDKPLIKVDNPRYAFAKILELFAPRLNVHRGIHPSAVIGKNPEFGRDVSIGALVSIGDNVRIGQGSVVMPGCHVGDDCVLGANCILYPNVTIYYGCLLGNRVMIHSGTVIGADGFGYMRIGDESFKVPQVGIVEIGDDVEIGANSAIDRAKTGSTVIEARTKIDNLVQIAHNVKIGPDCIIVGQVGIAGSTQLGKGVMIAGQAGLKDHITIGDGVIIMGQCGVTHDIPPGQLVSGDFARPHRDTLRLHAAFTSLPEHIARIKELGKSNEQLLARSEKLEQALVKLAEKTGIDVEI